MLLHLINQINDKDIFVSFNGRIFRYPITKPVGIESTAPVKLLQFQHMDICIFQGNFGSIALNLAHRTIESAILKFNRNSEDVPGWMIPGIYFAFLRTGDPSGLKEVVIIIPKTSFLLRSVHPYFKVLLEGLFLKLCTSG